MGALDDLVNYLIHPPKSVTQKGKSGEISDVAKARVLFRWITAQDLNTLDLTADAPPETALWHLRNIKNKKGEYSNLYTAMCM